MKTAIALEVDALVQAFGVTEKQARALIDWVRAKQTRKMSSTEGAREALMQAQHELKNAFPDHESRMDIVNKTTKAFGL